MGETSQGLQFYRWIAKCPIGIENSFEKQVPSGSRVETAGRNCLKHPNFRDSCFGKTKVFQLKGKIVIMRLFWKHLTVLGGAHTFCRIFQHQDGRIQIQRVLSSKSTEKQPKRKFLAGCPTDVRTDIRTLHVLVVAKRLSSS